MADPNITPPPAVPNRSETTVFTERMDAFLAWLGSFAVEIAAAIAWISAQVATITTAAGAAETARASAQAAAPLAEVSAGAAAHVPDAAYEAGDRVWSNVNFQTYRAKTDHSDVAADPSADQTNWAGLSSPDAVAKRARLHSLWIG
jgi:hypothetical protein